MDIRYSTGKEPFKRMTTEEIRDEFLIENIFIKNDVTAVYSHIDRIVLLAVCLLTRQLSSTKTSTQ